MENRTTPSNVTGYSSADALQASAIFDIIAKLKATARVKQRSVEKLIESAQATQGKVLQRFNDHIDQLELEKVRLKKETESYKAIHDTIELQLEDARREQEKLRQEKEEQSAGFAEIKKDFEHKLNVLAQDNGQLNSRIATLEKETKEYIQKNSELEQQIQALQADRDRRSKEHGDVIAELEADKADSARQQQQLFAEKNELATKVGSLETEVAALKAEATSKMVHLSDELERAKTAAIEAENERKKAEAKLIKFQKAWDQLEG